MLPTKTLAPELTAAVSWINTSCPLSLKQLRGKVVLLDFWTFCCVDCLHMLPYLQHLEEQFPEELVVIGVHNEGLPPVDAVEALQCDLSSPWDLVGYDGQLFICMAGAHQIWALDAAKGTMRLHAGNGKESLVDGPLSQAQFAQPSGISTDGRSLFVADAETSSVRRVDIDRGGVVATIVGTGLFDFGDRDGQRSPVLLQHPIGITQHNAQLFICDTYNHKIKRLDPQTGATVTLAGDRAGFQDGDAARFAEPGGLCRLGDLLVVADTNNHALRRVHIKTGHTSTLLSPDTSPHGSGGAESAALCDGSGGAESAALCDGSGGRKPACLPADQQEVWPNLVETTCDRATVACDTQGTVLLHLQFPAGIHLNADAPLSACVVFGGATLPCSAGQVLQGVELSLQWPASPAAGELLVRAQFIYCTDSEGAACHVASRGWRLPITLAAGAKNSLVILTAAL